ncbi:hypothetical protein F1188_03875 [Roseospira marina]|uniref:SGNH hydrolase-type esterase domain-containing protein n=1 Tax=Roseospira marina TaxID=140057 RepID=A0A5M6IFN4_9PROT|nr:GDSL-type esterase/lipase family protein [Roseospira marina]KAA5607054.1 hypothetical protein F1188_03875 [Roseospira marina]MBB4312757.1 lysophospholipase L1-like esterase [Roseospira marina]MBB5086470.1 lysophospholipase L1-like esterase [Roseospira marina]
MTARHRLVVWGLIGSLVLAAVLGGVAWTVRSEYIDTKLAQARAERGPIARSFDEGWPDRSGPRVLLIGDSRVAHWKPYLPTDLPVMERGLPGETAVQLARRFSRDGLGAGADIIVVQAGINDLVAASLMPADARAAVVDAVSRAFAAMHAAAEGAGICLVPTTIVPPSHPSLARWLVWDSSVFGMVEHVNARLRAAGGPSGTAVLDAAALLAPEGRVESPFRRDTLHLTAPAYDALNAALRQHVMDLAAACR